MCYAVESGCVATSEEVYFSCGDLLIVTATGENCYMVRWIWLFKTTRCPLPIYCFIFWFLLFPWFRCHDGTCSLGGFKMKLFCFLGHIFQIPTTNKSRQCLQLTLLRFLVLILLFIFINENWFVHGNITNTSMNGCN